MKTRFTLALLVVFALIISCTKTPTPEPEPTPIPPSPKDTVADEDWGSSGWSTADTADVNHYILTFVEPKAFVLDNHINSASLELWYRTNITYSFQNDSTSQAGKKYTELCKRYNDVGYNKLREFWPCYVYNSGYDYLAANLTSIRLFALTNYNEQYPAGSLLNDICMIEYQSPLQYIADGYTGDVKAKNTKPLNQCTIDDMVLMGDGQAQVCYLKLTVPPAPGVKPEMIAKITDERGRVFECTTEEFK